VFTAVDLSRIPFLNPDGVNLVAVIRTMESFEHRSREMEKCYTRQATIYASGTPRSENSLMAGMHSVGTSRDQGDDLDITHESHSTTADDNNRTPDPSVNDKLPSDADDNNRTPDPSVNDKLPSDADDNNRTPALSVNDKLPSDAVCSFPVDTTGAFSLIHHIFVSIPLYDLVTSVEIAQ